MIFGRYPFSILPFSGDRRPESFSTKVAFVEAETLGATGQKRARTPVALSETETLSAVGTLRARVPVAFVESETLGAASAMSTNKFIKLINQVDARRVYVMSMTVKQFRE
tara:strand:- start:6114 stop:6443 length:330 start_codon:yes stop_codon:yes gene_type:complete